MKNSLKLTAILLMVITSSCSGIKVLDAWKSDSAANITDNNILVISRTDNKQARIAFEQEIAKQLRAEGMKATESFKEMPNFNHDEKLTEAQQKNFKEFLENEGYNAVIVTVVKDYQERTQTTQDGGYYAGASYMPAYYPGYYGGFYGYYGNPFSYSTYGSYVPMTSTTQVVKTYIVETVAYDLTQENGKQLAAVVTTKIDDPQNVTKNAVEYTEKITKALTDK
ncbi:MAG: hypothetical protein CMC55_05065 [Flavobacteriaceae bacterium]|uniref:hypothetical protein n=1 Tax=Bizionia echini TaxID=649333 RepID=UPI000C8AEAB1|nr:hypothetical protein [Flavobacteriaceae bacterium]